MNLCSHCQKCYGLNKKTSKTKQDLTDLCFVCSNKLEKTEEMISQAASLIRQEHLETLSLTTNIPKEWLVREEHLWDISLMPNSQSIKNFLNRYLKNILIKRCGCKAIEDGDCRITFDYEHQQVSISQNELFIFGRYRKLVPGLSQSRWLCANCSGKGCGKCNGLGKNYVSIEEIIGEAARSLSSCQDYILHASGREDVDVTNIAGRAFVLELKKPKTRSFDLGQLRSCVSEKRQIEIINLRFVRRSAVEFVTESHFDKTYEALIEFELPLSSNHLGKISSLQGALLLQTTPNRVLHRRANIVRRRHIRSLSLLESKNNLVCISVVAEAGTYIKEFISGDNGRTHPSISEQVGLQGICKNLSVVKIDDSFLDFYIQHFAC